MATEYIDVGVAPYALADAIETLFKNGVTNLFVTKEDNDLHLRWKYDINRRYAGKPSNNKNDMGCGYPEPMLDDNGKPVSEIPNISKGVMIH